MKNKWLSILFLTALTLEFLSGCGSTSDIQTVSESDVVVTSEDSSSDMISSDNDRLNGAALASDQEATKGEADESDENVPYMAQGSEINLSDYAVNSVVTINAAGEYVLSGTLSNGQVVVNVGDQEEVQLYLNNVEITNDRGSAILIQNAEKVVMTLVESTNNIITDGTNYSVLDESGEPDAAIFAHDDLTINGSGSLTVVANYSEGIESRDDLKIIGGNISVIAVGIGIFGNNSFEMESALLDVAAGGDAIHSDGDILIASGVMTLTSGDDGIHADDTIIINGGTIDIQQSYEGIEATDVVINGGTIDIVASDDGINGAGGNDGSGNAGVGPQDNFSGSQCSITIAGGTIMITAATSGNGDGLDANGTITITGGELVIKEPSSYRDYSTIDFNTTFSLTGGSVSSLNAHGVYTEVTESNVSGGRGKGGR